MLPIDLIDGSSIFRVATGLPTMAIAMVDTATSVNADWGKNRVHMLFSFSCFFSEYTGLQDRYTTSVVPPATMVPESVRGCYLD
jgi:hypothetical protein